MAEHLQFVILCSLVCSMWLTKPWVFIFAIFMGHAICHSHLLHFFLSRVNLIKPSSIQSPKVHLIWMKFG